jgi:hypothetical protein
MLSDEILAVVGAQFGAKSGEGSRDLLDMRFFGGFARPLLLFLANAKETLVGFSP